MELTHASLCQLAVSWLKRPHSRQGPGCQVAITESKCGWLDGEIPDAIGFRAGVFAEASVLVECKLSRGDFLADKKKPHRVDPSQGMGMYRYYLAPQGLLSPSELPDRWGLIEVTTRGGLKVVQGHVFRGHVRDEHEHWVLEEDTWCHEHNIQRERSLLARVLYQVGDADKLQAHLKELKNRNSRLIDSNESLKKEKNQLSLDLFLLRHKLDELENERSRGGGAQDDYGKAPSQRIPSP